MSNDNSQDLPIYSKTQVRMADVFMQLARDMQADEQAMANALANCHHMSDLQGVMDALMTSPLLQKGVRMSDGNVVPLINPVLEPIVGRAPGDDESSVVVLNLTFVLTDPTVGQEMPYARVIVTPEFDQLVTPGLMLKTQNDGDCQYKDDSFTTLKQLSAEAQEFIYRLTSGFKLPDDSVGHQLRKTALKDLNFKDRMALPVDPAALPKLRTLFEAIDTAKGSSGNEGLVAGLANLLDEKGTSLTGHDLQALYKQLDTKGLRLYMETNADDDALTAFGMSVELLNDDNEVIGELFLGVNYDDCEVKMIALGREPGAESKMPGIGIKLLAGTKNGQASSIDQDILNDLLNNTSGRSQATIDGHKAVLNSLLTSLGDMATLDEEAEAKRVQILQRLKTPMFDVIDDDDDQDD